MTGKNINESSDKKINEPDKNIENDLEEPEFERLDLKDKVYLCLILSVCFAINVFIFSLFF